MSGNRQALETLDALRLRVEVVREVDPTTQRSFGKDHEALLAQIDGSLTVVELLATWGRAGATRALAAFADLLRWHAVALRPVASATPSVPAAQVVAAPPNGEVIIDERLLSESNDLDQDAKRRILEAARLLRTGKSLELLGVSAGADRVELKRAYFALAKQFHPDRFYGKNLGSFTPLVNMVFAAASQAVKTLVDQRTVARQHGPDGRQRRRSRRYAAALPVRLRCESWQQVVRAKTRQLSDGGLFVGTEQPAAPGERVAIELSLPDEKALRLDGKIVARVQAKGAKPPGLCVKFDTLDEAVKLRLGELLEKVKKKQPRTADEPLTDVVERVRIAKGSGLLRHQDPVIGIDLGTSYTSVSTAIGGKVHVLPWADGTLAIPSIVAFGLDRQILVGRKARERLWADPRHAVASAKRFIGRSIDDPEIQGQLTTVGYETLKGPSGELLFNMWGEPYAVPQICSYLLDAARVTAERVLGMPVGRAVITVPVSFTAERMELVKRAARLAHLEVLDIIDEPSAAALANRGRSDFHGIIGVYDFGGGTFDFSAVDATGGDFRVIATAGDSWLGGDDFDEVLADALANHFWRASGVALKNRAVEWQQLLFAAEHAKRQLSSQAEAQVVVPEVARSDRGTADLRVRVLREHAEQLWQPLIDRSLNTALQTLAMAGLQPGDLTSIYLSGGTTHIPAVKQALHRYFGIAPRTGVPADFAVCLGAGIHAAQLELDVGGTTLKPASRPL